MIGCGHPSRKRLKVKKFLGEIQPIEKQCNTKMRITLQEAASLSVWPYVYYDVMQTLNIAQSKLTRLSILSNLKVLSEGKKWMCTANANVIDISQMFSV